jgi:hypothetical protein
MGFAVIAGDGSILTMKSTIDSGEHVGHVKIDTLPPLPAGGNVVGAVTQSGSWSFTLGASLPAGANTIGGVTLAAALPAGSSTIGGTFPVPPPSAGVALSRIISAANTNASVIKASAGRLLRVLAVNTGTSPRYVKLYNSATSPTVGTDTPLLTLTVLPGGGLQASFEWAVSFAAGISIAITGGAADADTTAIAAGEVIVHTQYI